MKYVVTNRFADLNDNRRVYEVGDEYPREGLEVSEERLAELSSTKNKAGFSVIKALPIENEEIPKEEPKVAKIANKPRKTATKTATRKTAAKTAK